MKFFSIFLLLILLSHLSFSQPGMRERFDAHKFSCDSGTTTVEINLCSMEKLEYADSLLNVLYRQVLRSLDKEIAEDEKKAKGEFKSDSSMVLFIRKEIDYNKRLKKTIIKSQQEWIKYRDMNAEVVGITYEGGSARSGAINYSMLEDTLDRIKILEAFEVH